MEHEWKAVGGFGWALTVQCVHCGLEVMTVDGWTSRDVPVEKDTSLPSCQLSLKFDADVVEWETRETQNLLP